MGLKMHFITKPHPSLLSICTAMQTHREDTLYSTGQTGSIHVHAIRDYTHACMHAHTHVPYVHAHT